MKVILAGGTVRDIPIGGSLVGLRVDSYTLDATDLAYLSRFPGYFDQMSMRLVGVPKATPLTREEFQAKAIASMTECYECGARVHVNDILWRSRCKVCCVRRLNWFDNNCDCEGNNR